MARKGDYRHGGPARPGQPPDRVQRAQRPAHRPRGDPASGSEAAIDALGYRANQAARQMRTGRSRLIAVRIEPTRDGINGSVLDRFLHGLTETAGAAGYRVMLYTADRRRPRRSPPTTTCSARTSWTRSC